MSKYHLNKRESNPGDLVLLSFLVRCLLLFGVRFKLFLLNSDKLLLLSNGVDFKSTSTKVIRLISVDFLMLMPPIYRIVSN